MQPKAKPPLLVNAHGHTTIHRFTRREPVTIPIVVQLATGELREHMTRATALIYTCTETGLEKRYGVE